VCSRPPPPSRGGIQKHLKSSSLPVGANTPPPTSAARGSECPPPAAATRQPSPPRPAAPTAPAVPEVWRWRGRAVLQFPRPPKRIQWNDVFPFDGCHFTYGTFRSKYFPSKAKPLSCQFLLVLRICSFALVGDVQPPSLESPYGGDAVWLADFELLFFKAQLPLLRFGGQGAMGQRRRWE